MKVNPEIMYENMIERGMGIILNKKELNGEKKAWNIASVLAAMEDAFTLFQDLEDDDNKNIIVDGSELLLENCPFLSEILTYIKDVVSTKKKEEYDSVASMLEAATILFLSKSYLKNKLDTNSETK